VALCLRTSETIHLVITDMMMPVMDGPRAMRALRELRPELRFIAMSGLQQSEQIREQIGDATFVPKPFSGDRLLRVVREVLSNRGGETRFYRRSFGPGFATELRTRFEPMKA
jgi:DNA-binding NtrC family response regulator